MAGREVALSARAGQVPGAYPLPIPVLRTDYRLRSADFGSAVLVAPIRWEGAGGF